MKKDNANGKESGAWGLAGNAARAVPEKELAFLCRARGDLPDFFIRHSVQELETRLTEMLESVQGAGKVQVMITLESAGETVYARDEQSDTQTTQDGSDGVTDRKESYKSEHIIVDAADGKQPLVETHIEPEVKGVAVV